MSIASQITRITNLRNNIKAKLIRLGLLQESVGPEPTRSITVGDDLAACNTAIQSINETTPCWITDTQQTNVAEYKYAQVRDSDLIQSNIKDGVTILGVTGTYQGSGGTQMDVGDGYYVYGGSGLPQSIRASSPIYNPDGSTPYSGSSYDGFSVVTPVLDPNATLIASNIKNGVTIEGVMGTYPYSEALEIRLGSSPDLSSSSETYTPSSGDFYDEVTVSIDSTVIKPANIKDGVTILGVTGTCTGQTVPTTTLQLSQQNLVNYGITNGQITFNPPTGYNFDSVQIDQITNVLPANIVYGQTILDVQGSAWSFKYRMASTHSTRVNNHKITFTNMVCYPVGSATMPSDLNRITSITLYRCDRRTISGSTDWQVMAMTWFKQNVTSQQETNNQHYSCVKEGGYLDCVSYIDIADLITIESGTSLSIDIGDKFTEYDSTSGTYDANVSETVKFASYSGNQNREYYISIYYV